MLHSNSSANCKKRVVITGATGLLGRSLYNEFEKSISYNSTNAGEVDWEIIGFGFTRATHQNYIECDLLDETKLRNTLNGLKPDIVIHCASIQPKSIGYNEESMKHFNVKSTENLAKICTEVGSWILYVSCSDIFDGINPPYSSNADAKPLNSYAQSKKDAETVLWKCHSDAGVLRVSNLYSVDPISIEESEITRIAKDLLNSKSLELDNWQIIYPTLASDVAFVIRQLSERKVAHCGLYGTWHWSGSVGFTRFELAYQIVSWLNITNPSIKSTDTLSKTQNAYNSALNCVALQVMNIGKNTSLKQSIQNINI